MEAELRYWYPGTTNIQIRTEFTANDFKGLAIELLERYRQSGDILPGIEIQKGDGPSLSIAIAPFGWALIYTDSEFNQHRTIGSGDNVSVEVQWDETTLVPYEWFIPANDAFVGISQYLHDGTLSQQLTWADQSF